MRLLSVTKLKLWHQTIGHSKVEMKDCEEYKESDSNNVTVPDWPSGSPAPSGSGPPAPPAVGLSAAAPSVCLWQRSQRSCWRARPPGCPDEPSATDKFQPSSSETCRSPHSLQANNLTDFRRLSRTRQHFDVSKYLLLISRRKPTELCVTV